MDRLLVKWDRAKTMVVRSLEDAVFVEHGVRVVNPLAALYAQAGIEVSTHDLAVATD